MKCHQLVAARGAQIEAAGLFRRLIFQEGKEGFRHYLVTTLLDLGAVASSKEGLPEPLSERLLPAHAYFNEAEETYLQLGGGLIRDELTGKIALAQSHYGMLLAGHGYFRDAIASLHHSIARYKELGDKRDSASSVELAITLSNLGSVLNSTRQFGAAREALEEAIDLYNDLSQHGHVLITSCFATCLIIFGKVLISMEQEVEALRAFAKVIAMCSSPMDEYRYAELEPLIVEAQSLCQLSSARLAQREHG